MAVVGEREGGGMPRRLQMKKVNSALERRAPWGMQWQRRMEAAPRTAQARRPSDGMRMGVGGEAEDNCLAGEGVGEDGLGVAIGNEADVGDGGGVGSGVEEEGMDRVE